MRNGGCPMTRFVVDCGVVLYLASEGFEVPTWARATRADAAALPDAVGPARGRASGRARLRRSPSTSSPASGPCRSASSATPSSAAGPGTSPTSWDGPRPTTPRTSPSRNCRRMRSSPWTTTWHVGSTGSSPRRPSMPCERPDAGDRSRSLVGGQPRRSLPGGPDSRLRLRWLRVAGDVDTSRS